MKIVIIGGEKSSIEFAKELRNLNKEIEIVIIEKMKYMSYSKAAMPYYISGIIEKENLMFEEDEEVLNKVYNIKIMLQTEVVEVLPEDKVIKVTNGINSNITKIEYDKLVIGVRTLAKKLEVFKNKGDNIFIHKNLQNAIRLKEYIELNNPKSVLIVGTGMITMQLAENLNRLGIDVTLIEEKDSPIPKFDTEISNIAQNTFEEYITVNTKCSITNVINLENNKLKVEFLNSQNKKNDIIVDFVIVNVGNIPGTRFLKRANISLDENDYILVNEKMQTNIENIYAIGETVTLKNNIGLNVNTRQLSAAIAQGRVLANNIANEISNNTNTNFNLTYDYTTATMLYRLFGMYVGKTGSTKKEIDLYNSIKEENKELDKKIEYFEVIKTNKTSEKIFGNAEEITIKCIFEKGTKKILGAQIIGKKDVERYLTIITALIKKEGTAFDLMYIEMPYMPKYNKAIDIINLIGEEGVKF